MTLGEVINTQAHTIVVVTNPESPFGGVQVLGVTNIPAQIILREGEPGAPGPPGPPGAPATDLPDSGATDRGVQSLVIGQSYIDVILPVAQPDTDYLITECLIINNTDVTPLNIWPGIITSKTLSGFRVQLNGLPDTGNYILHWAISGFVPVAFPATSYTLTGPATGPISAPSTFTVALPPGGTVDTPVIVTPGDGGAGGTFSPTTVTLTTTNASRTFTYTPASYGAKTISVTSDSSLTNPASITFTPLSGTYSLSGPSSGPDGAASTNFTVALPVGGAVTGTVTVTPTAGGGGGTFTPTTVNLTTAAPSATFIYTPASTGAKTISVTNNGGLTNPGNLSYTSLPPSLADGDPVGSWPDSSGNGRTATQTGSARPTFKTNIINAKPVARFVSASAQVLNLASAIPGATWTVFVVMKSVPGVNMGSIGSGTGGAGPFGPFLIAGQLYIAHQVSLYSSSIGVGGAFHVFTAASNANASQATWIDGTPGSISFGGSVTVGNFDTLGNSTGDGDLAEVIIYNVYMDAVSTNRANIEKYLATKYGLTVAGGSAVDPSTVSGLVGWWKADVL